MERSPRAPTTLKTCGSAISPLTDEASEPLIVREDRGGLVRAEVPVREVNRSLGLTLPDGETWSTIGGVCMHLAGGVPEPRSHLALEGVATFEIVEATPQGVRLVRIVPLPE